MSRGRDGLGPKCPVAHNTITYSTYVCTIFEDSSLHSSGENCDTNLALKDRKIDK